MCPCPLLGDQAALQSVICSGSVVDVMFYHRLRMQCGHWGLIHPRNIVDFGAVYIVCVCLHYHLLPFASCNLIPFFLLIF